LILTLSGRAWENLIGWFVKTVLGMTETILCRSPGWYHQPRPRTTLRELGCEACD